ERGLGGARQRDLRRDRRAPAPPADRSRAACEEDVMRKKRSSFGRRLGMLVLVVAVIGLGVLAYYATRPSAFAFAGGNPLPLDQYRHGQRTGVPADFKDPDPVARGRYLADGADCRSCHTADGGAAFAGGRAFKLPFGTLYTTNITPDKTAGIGNLTDAQFI